MSGVRAYLRQQTSDKHQELDSLLGNLQPFRSLPHYAIYLTGNAALIAHCTSALSRAAKLSELPPKHHALTAAIHRDLRAAGELGSIGSWAEVSQPSAVSDSQAWGTAYVLEGSAMGAQLLVSQARRQLPATATTEFLELLSADGPARFRQFCAAMDAGVVDPEVASSAARETFQWAIDCFQKLIASSQESLLGS
jgi:heme oxygenase